VDEPALRRAREKIGALGVGTLAVPNGVSDRAADRLAQPEWGVIAELDLTSYQAIH
jgi:hypothetical protein